MSIQAFHDQTAPIEGVKSRSKINFELDLGDDKIAVLDTYKGLTWLKTGVVDPVARYGDEVAGTGYVTGITSGKQVAFDYGGASLEFSAGGTFDFTSVQLTAAYASDLTVRISGYLDGEQKYKVSVHVNDLGPTLVKLGWEQVDDVRMTPSHAVPDPDQPTISKQFVMDDLVIANLLSATPVSHTSLSHASAGDAFAHGHDALAYSGGQHALAAITALV